MAALPEDEQDAGWDFIIANGERGRSNLKQLLWIHRHIKRDGSPINGWNEKLVQRALDSLANDGALAALISRYDLTIAALHPDLLSMLERILPHLRPLMPCRILCKEVHFPSPTSMCVHYRSVSVQDVMATLSTTRKWMQFATI